MELSGVRLVLTIISEVLESTASKNKDTHTKVSILYNFWRLECIYFERINEHVKHFEDKGFFDDQWLYELQTLKVAYKIADDISRNVIKL
ncbi:hypothetical protein Goe5_c01430 [Bacillus phage vB_BthM-Goe5]|nr:hypothetical protein Goe5_c01430 [Bacillus phage vB_BthM-Goe5]